MVKITKGHRRRYVAALALLAMLTMVAAPAAATGGPWIDLLSHSDGDVLLSKEVTVHGTVTEPVHTLTFKGEDLVHGEMSNIKWVNDNLRFRPLMVFEDQFVSSLDPSKWTIVRDPENVTLEDGNLKLNFQWAWPSPPSNGTLVKSTEFEVPDGVDFKATYKMRLSSYAYSGAGGGVSDGATSVWESHISTLGLWSGGVPVSWVKVVAGGESFFNSTGYDVSWHDYGMVYDSRSDEYVCYRDGAALGSYQMETMPSIWWFGHTEDTGLYDMRPTVEVDYVKLWATSGEWTSDVIDMGHPTVLEASNLRWNSSHKKEAERLLEVRASMDEENWTEWVPFDKNGDLASPINGTYYQLRLKLGIPDVLKDTAHVTVTGIDLLYRNPLVTVEVKGPDTDWMLTEGLHEWQADLILREDVNTVEVRATDTSGAVNFTSLELIVDTTPPVGTMAIAGDGSSTNDLNVTLLLEATDRYGVEWVDISHIHDFSKKLRLPYAESVDWRMLGVEGETYVHVRFIDAHGLISDVSTDSIFYDPNPPTGDVVIDGGAEYTSGHVVQLILSYSDNVDVEKVELSNDPGFVESWVVPDGITEVNDWRLAEDGDGERNVHIRVTDVAGNTFSDSDGIELYMPKSVGAVAIEEGAERTGHAVVLLTIDVPVGARVRLIQISNEQTFEGAEWDTVEKEVMWILEEEDGVKTVHVRFVDDRDIVSIPVTDSIVLDQTAPTVSVTLDGGSPYTTDPAVSGTIAYEDASGPVRMWVSMDDTFYRVQPVDFSEGFDFIIPARESDHRVYVRVEDEVGNLGVGSDMVHYATIRPYISLSLPGGNVVRPSLTIPVQVTPVDPYGDIHLQVDFDREPDEDAPWEPLNGMVHVDVPSGVMDGTHKIWIRARNAAGLTSEKPVSIKVTLDGVPPMLSILRPEDGSKLYKDARGVKLEVDVSDSSRLDKLVYVVDDGDPQNLSMRTMLVDVTLEKWGEHTIQVVAEDVAGNVATSTTVFKVEDADALRTGSGAGLLIVIALALVGAAIIAGYAYNRRFTPGLRSASIAEGDGWDEEWDHPHLEDCDDDRRPCELPVHAEDPIYLARKEKEIVKQAEAASSTIVGTELEHVDIPEELNPGDGETSTVEGWSEL